MLRKLIFFAITSGLAKKAYDVYKERQANVGPAPVTPVAEAPPVRKPAPVVATAPEV